MKEIEKMAENKAMQDAGEFWDSHEYVEIIEKFVYTENKARDLSNLINNMVRSGDIVSDNYYESFYYYKHYVRVLERYIACNELRKNGYKLDKDNKWIKTQTE